MTRLSSLALDAQAAALTLFNVLPAVSGVPHVSHAPEGFITDFAPSSKQLALLRSHFRPVDLTTLYALSEATGDLKALLLKQVLHYIEVYGLDAPGLLNLEVKGGQSTVLRFIKATSLEELTERVTRLIGANAPIADVTPVVSLVRALHVPYDINKIANRELRVALFDPAADVFESVEDAVRWLCWRATTDALLIKDPITVEAIKAFAASPENRELVVTFLEAYARPLAEVFNRHKRLFIPLKAAGPAAKRLVNRISRHSKTRHVPVYPAAAKVAMARVARGEAVDLDLVSLQDKFRYLNLIEYKLLGLPTDAFNIRNGKIWVALDRPVLDSQRLAQFKELVLSELRGNLAPLKGKRILLDKHIEYGLPVSRKQTFGNLPFGTALSVPTERKISVGIYWRNEWGARDLDLSAIDTQGERIGWGYAGAYGRKDVTFSGDITDAEHGACEFFTVDPSNETHRGLIVNIYRGNIGARAEILAGYPSISDPEVTRNYPEKTAESWQDRTLLRERIELKSKETLLGFLRGDRLVLYGGRLSSARISQGKQPVINRGLADLWTVNRLLEEAGIAFDTAAEPGVEYDHDLRYGSFSLDKLERMFEFGKESSL